MRSKLSFWSFLLLLLCYKGTEAQIISTIAGNGTYGYTGDNGPATSAQFNFPFGITLDNAGNIYITDYDAHVVRMINSAGIITTVAGNGKAGYSGDGGPATSAQLNGPNSITVDNSGNLYISDFHNSVIRKVNSSGIISTIVGNGTSGYSGDGGPALSAQLTPYGIAIDSVGNLYVCDIFNSVVRKVNSSGIINTIAGNGTVGYSGDGGPAIAAQFNFVYGITVDKGGSIYVVDYGNNVIRKVDCSGTINTIAGNGVSGYTGDGGPATSAQLAPLGVTIDNQGNLYVADHGTHVVRKINSIGIISTVAGNGTFGYSGDGGPATAAQLGSLYGVAVDHTGNLFICDNYYSVVRKVTGSTLASKQVQIQPFPMDSTICAGGQASFVVHAGPSYNHRWQVNNGSGWNNLKDSDVYSGVSSDSLLISGAPVSMSGNAYRCIIFNSCGFLLTSLSSILIVTPPVSIASVNITGSSNPVCAGSAISFLANQVNGGSKPSYQWQLNGKNVGADSSGFTCNNPADGDQVNCIMKSNFPCVYPLSVSSNNIIIRINQVNSSVSVNSSASTICSGDTAIFIAVPTNGGDSPSYQWQINQVNTGTNSEVFSSSKLNDGDIVNCIMKSSIACTYPALSVNPIAMKVYPSPFVAAGNDTIITGGKSMQMHPLINGRIVDYQWTPLTGLDNPLRPDPIASPVNTTTYKLVVTADNGCKASGKLTIGVFYGLQMPNAFTPNGDGKNDVFRIPASISVKIVSFSIYNRWGNKVFTTTDRSKGWDGTFNGQAQPMSTYIWEIVYEDVLSNRNSTKRGAVVLIR